MIWRSHSAMRRAMVEKVDKHVFNERRSSTRISPGLGCVVHPASSGCSRSMLITYLAYRMTSGGQLIDRSAFYASSTRPISIQLPWEDGRFSSWAVRAFDRASLLDLKFN